MDYYREFLHSIKTSRLLLAYKWEKVVAGGIFVFEKGVSFYYYWASTSDKEYRNMMAPYLLQWEAIVMAKWLGSKIYDFLWVASPWESDSSLVWVTDFKGKFTSDVRQVSESYIWINRKIVYTFIVFLKKLRMLFR
jgi:lipid II:glycine glycyltransferase (peptidoglycan interpeptide bridge formation enzyme)